MLDLRDDTAVRSKNIFCPKVARMGTARAVPAIVPQKWPKLGKCPPPEPPKWHFFGRSRGHGAHDNDGTWPRAREKRETKRTTRDREEQLEVRGAFCFLVLARARADSVGGGAPACTGRAPGDGGTHPPPSNLIILEESATQAVESVQNQNRNMVLSG